MSSQHLRLARLLTPFLVLACMSPAAIAADPAMDCKVWPTRSAQLRQLLGNQAVAIAERAARSSADDEPRMAALVASDAIFDLGSGDVGRPMGKGWAGLRKLMGELQADRYRFDGWDYMSREEAPCGTQEVTIEFSSVKRGDRAEVTFRFAGGKVVEGRGWQRSTTVGEFLANTKGQ